MRSGVATPGSTDPVAGAPTGTRRQSIDYLRRILTNLTGPDASLCRVAAERGIFCRGFRRWHVAEFDRRWRGAIGRSTHLSRPQMEKFADLWQLTEQVSCGVSLACDANRGEGSPCRGWDEFSDEELARFCRELAADDPSSRGTATATATTVVQPEPFHAGSAPGPMTFTSSTAP